ncbi:MAG: bacteriophage holin [Alphaproteobacteria bacterium]|uniref:Bacteriophage holin n=1 Tax=Candidatus Nitrobium versatile TaxID=2884831 RepID=A0A953JBY1_9BACT|nr:bacteriophage holin [Candidatus Nitrobium versatile]
MRLQPVALGVALGAVWGASLFLTTWVSFYSGYGRLFLEVLARSIYPGYTISPAGSFLGLAYGFLDGFVSASLIAWIYNKVANGGQRHGTETKDRET